MKLGFWGSFAVFVLTVFLFLDLGLGLIFGAGLFDLIGGVDSPLAVALADKISSGNVAVFYGVCGFLVFFIALLMYLSAGAAFGKKVRR